MLGAARAIEYFWVMQRVIALAGAVVALAGCGSAPSVDFFEPSMGGASAGGASAGGASAGSAPAMAGATPISSGGSTSGPDTPCSPVKEASNMTSGDFQSTGPLCLKVTDEVVGWGCSNFEGRTIEVNGTTVTCGQVPLPEKQHGAYYFYISAGEFSYASFYWWSG